MACARALAGSSAVCLTSTRIRFSRATDSTFAVRTGPMRCELCLGTLIFRSRWDFVEGDMGYDGAGG